ncbi:HEAT repeat domain-containing protein, partial [Nodosilinea sp. AN01ver1]|uniref:HEAT repeat domain-containing protein n=1 Tax=Nodosilinea sp. AN01ver1 TaxID=3423362 RepID=UPI003D317626
QQDRNAAANALGGIGADAKEAVPTLISLLESQHQEDRSAAANALGRIGAVEEEVVPALITLLKSANVDDRYSGVEALGNIGPDAEEAVPVLIPLLADNAVDSGAGVFPVSEATMDTLGAIGPKAKAAIPDLVEQLGNPNDKDNAQSKSRVAAINLLHIDPFLNVLLENLTSNNNLAQESSAFALGLTGSADQRVIDNLLGIVNDQAEVIEVRLAAAQSLTLFNQDVSWFYSENGFDSIYKEWLSCPVHPLEGVPAKGSKLFFDPGLRECTDLMTGSGTGPGPLVIGDRILPPPPPPAGKN